MNAEHWQAVKALFNELIELNQSEREKFIKVNHADKFILDEALKLVDAVTVSISELTMAVGQNAQDIVETTLLEVGDTLGAYQITECIGVGGMGVVFKARRMDQAIDHEVAIKIIHSGLLHAMNVEKFKSERLILSRLQHRFIAQAFDAGETHDGLLYMIMEYIDGEAITDYAQRHFLNLKARLELLIDICSAIHFAHQKGIIHRDLKPSNILVSNEANILLPKIIDFGISHSVTSSTEEKNNREFGTPLYMSPEHSETDYLLDTRADVYSLGIIFYELLTDKLPFDLGQNRSSKTQEPTIEFAALAKYANAKELFAIAKKATATNPDERYQTVEEFKNDIARYINNEPVQAIPYSFLYHLKKRIVRHRALSLMVFLLISALFIGSLAVTVALYKENQARIIAENAQREAERQTQRIKATQNFLFNVLISPSTLGKEVKVIDSLDYALENLDKQIPGEHLIQVSILKAIGSSYMTSAHFDKARNLFERALLLLEKNAPEEHQEIISLHNDLGQLQSYQRRYHEAIAIYQKNLVRCKQYLPVGHHLCAASLNNIGSATYALATQTQEEFQKIIYASQGIDAIEKSLALQRQYIEKEYLIELTYSEIILAYLYSIIGKHEASVTLFKKVIAALKAEHGDGHYYTVNAMGGLAQSLIHLGQLEEAEKHYSHVVNMMKKLKGIEHPATLTKMLGYARLLKNLNKDDAAKNILKEAIMYAKKFDVDHSHYFLVSDIQTELNRLDSGE